MSDSVHSRRQTHVHELRLCEEDQPALDGLVDLELKDEVLAHVIRVLLKCRKDLRLLVAVELVRGDDGNLLFPVQLHIQLLVLASNFVNVQKSFVRAQELDELDGQRLQRDHAGDDFDELLSFVLRES